MRELIPPTPKVQKLRTVVPVSLGGTGSPDSPGAALNLGGIETALLGTPGNVAKVQSNSGVDIKNYPTAFPIGATIEGPSEFYASTTYNFTISNYDKNSDDSYAVGVSAGSVSRHTYGISLTTPATPGTIELTIGQRKVKLLVKPAGTLKPSFVSPLNGSANNSVVVYLTSSTFAISSGTASHLSSDWEISTSPDFSNVVKSSFNDTVNKTTLTVENLKEATSYYARVRYRDSVLGNSDWSDSLQFSTKYKLNYQDEEARLLSTVPISPEYFGWYSSLSADGSRATFIGLRAENLRGAVYVFRREGTAWVFEQRLLASDGAAQDFMGYRGQISEDGTRIAVGAVLAESGSIQDQGAVYIFVRTGNVWFQEAKLSPSAIATGNRFGWGLSFSKAADRVAVSSPYYGGVFIFRRSGTTWYEEANFSPADKQSVDLFGQMCEMNADGDRLFIGAPGVATGGKTSSGAVYVYVRTGATWTIDTKIVPVDVAASDAFGTELDVSSDGTVVAVTAPGVLLRKGAVYIFRLTGGIWNQEAKLFGTDSVSGDSFSVSVAMKGDGSTIIVGAEMATVANKVACGAFYVFKKSALEWTQTAKVISSDSTAGDQFGHYVSISSDGGRATAGAPYAQRNGLVNSGVGYIFS